MIVIALSALAYTWFSGIFASMTQSAGTAVTTTTSAMATQFSIDSAKGSGTTVNIVYRNTGTQNINRTQSNVYVNDAPCTFSDTGTLGPSQYTSPAVAATNCPSCTCSGGICYNSNKIETAILTIGSGLQQSATVTC